MFKSCRRGLSNEIKGRSFSINGQNVKATAFLAEGSYAKLYQTSNPAICLKIMTIESQQELQVAKRECYVLAELKETKNCLHLIAMYFDGELENIVPETFSEVCLFVEYCDIQVENLLGEELSDWQINEVLVGAALGLKEMKNHGLIHRDFKCENVLLLHEIRSQDVRICDFGSVSNERFAYKQLLQDQELVRQLEEEIETTTTPEYRAPELINLYSKFDITEKTDIFAFGVFAYKLIFKQLPFVDGELLSNFNCKWEFPCSISDTFTKLLEMTLVKEPDQRASIEDVISLLGAQSAISCREKSPFLMSEEENEELGQCDLQQSEVLSQSNTAELKQHSFSNTENMNNKINELVEAYLDFADFRVELQIFLENYTINELYAGLLEQVSAESNVRIEIVKLSICVYQIICVQGCVELPIFDRYLKYVEILPSMFKTVFCLASLARQLACLTNIQEESNVLTSIEAHNCIPPLNALLMIRDENIWNFEASIIGFACEFIGNEIINSEDGVKLYHVLFSEFEQFRDYYDIKMQLIEPAKVKK